jgi:acetyl-CoA carboxylase biotin carboxyl carrier protein
MDLNEIHKIIKLLENTDITEIEIEKNNERIKIRRGRIFQYKPNKPKTEDIVKSGSKKDIIVDNKRLKTITSPIVGTFYRAPSPGASPFVKEGSVVEKGQVLCIIEAMKLMNEIEAEFRASIISILVENGQPVEYGEPLFVVEPL